MFASNTALGTAHKQRVLCHLLTASTHPSIVPQHIHLGTHRSHCNHTTALAQPEHSQQQQQQQQKKQIYETQHQPGVQHTGGIAAAPHTTSNSNSNSTTTSNGIRSSSSSSSSHKHPAVFKFRHFTLQHGGPCAMRMGTDSMLLGAWAQPTDHTAAVLDVGTGSGVLALMMAQKTQQQAAAVHALDIDAASVTQATANAAASPWAHRLSVHLCSLQDWTQNNSHNSHDASTNSRDTEIGQTDSTRSSSSSSGSSSSGGNRQRYDAIISNPPYFLRSSKPDASHRAAARHADVTLPFLDLAQCSAQLLAPEGRLFVVLPVQEAQLFVGEAAAAGLVLTRCTQVFMKSTDKQPKRHLMQFEAAAADAAADTAADTAAVAAAAESAAVAIDQLVVLVPNVSAAANTSNNNSSSSSSYNSSTGSDAGSSSDSISSSNAKSSPPAWVFSEQYRQLTVDFHHPDLLT